MAKKDKKEPPVKKNDRVILDINALGSQGQGIGRVDGYAVFVPLALKSERVEAHIIKVGPSYAVGKLIEVIKPSPSRVEPICPISGRCGACGLLHMSYADQLSFKRDMVRDALVRLGGIQDVHVDEVIGMDEPFHYRNKTGFPFTYADGRVELGFFALHSHRVIPVSECVLLRENVMDAAANVRDWANAYNVSVYDEKTRGGLLRHVVVREGSTGELMVTVVASAQIPHTDELISLLKDEIKGLKSVYLNINDKDTNVIQGEYYRLLYGEPSINEEILGLKLKLGPYSFLQVNHAQAQKAYTCASDMLKLKGDESVIDAYCGIGAISLLLARHAKNVIGIENVAEAVEDAEYNASANGIQNARFIKGEAEHVLPSLVSEGTIPDALVLDPPRKGADDAFIQALIKSRVKKLVYISCNCATMARDCAKLVNGGYEINKVQPVDMFANTPHVETVVLMSKLKSTTSIEVNIDLDEMDLTKSESKATYNEIKQYVLDKYGFKVSQLYIAQVKRKNGIIERENYNTGDGKAKVPQVSLKKEKAIEDALRYFKMI